MPAKVSIQIPTYNQQQFIGQAIQSALMQDYPNLEVVVADDCSTDNTEQIVRQFNDPRLRYFKNPTNIGRVANYRKALYEYCSGEWVVNLDGDDYYTNPHFISRGIGLIEEYRAKGDNVVFYQALHGSGESPEGVQQSKRHSILQDKPYGVFDNYYLEVYRKNKFFSHLTTIYHRPTATRIGFYEYNTLSTDFESIAKLSFYGKAILDNTVVGVWRIHGSNATHATRAAFRQNGEKQFQRIEEYAREAYGEKFVPTWRNKVRHENQVLYLELLAENGYFLDLVRNIFRYRLVTARTPVMLVKAFLRNMKVIMTGRSGINA